MRSIPGLRPSGAQGPVAVSIEGFRKYQQESAWTWEHMALTRARPIFGGDAARTSVRDVINTTLAGARRERDIAADAGAMRADMAEHKPPAGPLDAKLLPGGLVDVEFAVHVLQLIERRGFSPDLRCAIAGLTDSGLIDPAMLEAHDFLTRLLVTLRLVAPDAQPPAETSRPLVARAVGCDDWDAVLASLDATRQVVERCWGGGHRRQGAITMAIEIGDPMPDVTVIAPDGVQSACAIMARVHS